MKKILPALAIVISSAAVVLALDLGGLKFKQIDAGGHPLRMWISGQGNPPVIFEAGGSPADGGPLECWQWVQPAVSKFTTAVSYDRAGIGLSPAGPKPRDARQVARELHAALGNAGIQPPYILVGHSMGGPFIRVFADLYPNDVSGLILVDPTQEEAIDWETTHDTNHVARTDEEWKEIDASLREAHSSRVPDGIPVVLITAMGPQTFPDSVTEEQIRKYREGHKRWLQFHNEWIEKLPRGKHIITEKSGHVVPFTEPELIVDEIRKMVSQSKPAP